MALFSRVPRIQGALDALAGRRPAELQRSVNDHYALGLSDWADFGGLFMPGGYPIQLGFNQTLGGKQEEIRRGFTGLIEGAYRANSVVFACMLTRLSLFTEARFQYQRMNGGRPGDLWGDASLALLEHPWPSGATGDLLGRAIQSVDLAGNAFVVRMSRDRLVVPRPDWITIVLGSSSDPDVEAGDLDAEVLGYIYHPGGRNSGRDIVPLQRQQVAHFAPIPDPLATYRGMSWLEPLAREVMADTAATTHKLQYFENGATVNLAISLDPGIGLQAFESWIEAFERGHRGVANAYKTLYLGAGAKPVPIGSNLQELDFKITQGAGETRIAAASGVHPVIVGLSEGLQGSSLNAGNFSSARRLVADRTMRPLWRNFAASLESIFPPPGGSRLWYDDRDIAFLREDRRDAADIEQVRGQTIRTLIEAGFKADDVVKAVEAEDMGLLIGKHTGLFSVQLQAPGAVHMPAGEVPGEVPVGGGTQPETLPKSEPSTKPVSAGPQPPGNGRSPAPTPGGKP